VPDRFERSTPAVARPRFEACFNFRDLGGHATTDGRVVRHGLVFRSGSLHRMTASDRAEFGRLGVTTVVDLRRPDEVARHPPPIGIATVRHLPLEIDPPPEPLGAPCPPGAPEPPEAPEPPADHLGDEYLDMVQADPGRRAIAAAFRLIAEPAQRVVVHCYAGKDRTGIVAALLLASLGVDDEAIIADYTASDAAIEPSRRYAERHDVEWARLIDRLPPRVLHSHPDGIVSMLDGVRKKFGSVVSYLHEIGATPTYLTQLEAKLLA
jgi:protein-tyrosine phosphatase